MQQAGRNPDFTAFLTWVGSFESDRQRKSSPTRMRSRRKITSPAGLDDFADATARRAAIVYQHELRTTMVIPVNTFLEHLMKR